MNMTPEQEELGRRNFLRALAGTPAVAALGVAAIVKGPVPGGPVRLGFVGLGSQGRLLVEQTDPRFGEIKAFCEINPLHMQQADEALQSSDRPPAKHYESWKEMIEKEDLEAVVVATPLFLHSDIATGALNAGLHVLCEKMMAWDVEGCVRMAEAARRNGRLLEIGHQRHYNPVYQAAREGVIKPGLLGEMYYSRLVWHRDGSWRREVELPAPGYDPTKWGYPDLEHLINWRLYDQYSRGLLSELGSHQVAIANWFWDSVPEVVIGSGGIYRYKDGRQVPDHVYATFEYPGGRTALFSSIQSNDFDHYYEGFYGTEGTLILKRESEAYLFTKDEAEATGIEMVPQGAGPVGAASESRAAEAAGGAYRPGQTVQERVNAYQLEISGFCASVRTGVPLKCGPELAMGSAKACLAAWDAIANKARVAVPATSV
jgi:predicted dehydrogenase